MRAQVVVGMPHRGRLNVLANVLEKPLEMIFKEFGALVQNLQFGTPAAAATR